MLGIEEKIYGIPVTLTSYRRKKDGSVGFGACSLYEVPNKDIGLIDESLGRIGTLILSDSISDPLTDKEIKEAIAISEDRDIADVKSHSQRLRAVLWVLCEQTLGRKPTSREFLDFYSERMEKLIEQIKGRLEDRD